MISNYFVPLANHMWQSSLFAGVVWTLALVLRKNQAAIRHRLWFAASVKFLVPFSFIVGMGSHVQWLTSPNASAPVSIVVAQISQPFALSEVPVPPAVVSTPSFRLDWVSAILLGFWICGFAASVGWWFIRWQELRRLVQRAAPLNLDFPLRVMSCRERIEPGVFGVFRPVLLVPEGITDRLSSGQLRTVLAHEFCHIGRRDNITAAIHMFAEALFWFYPLVWWIRRRLIEEQERACDEEVLLLGSDPHVYAESILKICEFCIASPLMCAPGIMSSDLRKRIRDILNNQAARKLTFSRKIMLGAAGLIAVAGPLTVGIMNAPAMQAQARLGAARPVFEAFEVATIKPASTASPARYFRMQSAHQFYAKNYTLKALVGLAWDLTPPAISGGPSWVDSDHYDILAKTPNEIRPNRDEQMSMLRKLLIDRFKLTFHREQKEFSVYSLTVARNGPKLKESTAYPDAAPEGPLPLVFTISPGDARLPGRNATMAELASVLQRASLGRPVVDRTGLSGRFDFDLEWAPDETQFDGIVSRLPSVPDEDKPDLFRAIQQQLGLSLEKTKGTVETLVVDQAERPPEN